MKTSIKNALFTISLTACADVEPEGLVVDELLPQSARGSFTEAGTSIAFEVSNVDGVRRATLRDADGNALVESSLDGDLETTTILGRLTIVGIPNEPAPQVIGDRTALDQLAAMPEGGLARRLPAVLANTGIDDALFARPVIDNTRSDYTEAFISCGASRDFPTWSYWMYMKLRVSHAGPWRAWVRLTDYLYGQPFSFDHSILPDSGRDFYAANGAYPWDFSWISWSVKVTNLCWESYGASYPKEIKVVSQR